MADEDFGDINHAPRGGHGGQDSSGHVSVLLKEAIDFLAVKRGGTYIDATLGSGGHSCEIAKRLGPQGRLIGFDKDPAALEIARKRLGHPPPEFEGNWPQVTLVHASFAEIGELALVHPIYHLIGGTFGVRVHPHVERSFRLKAESPLRIGQLQ